MKDVFCVICHNIRSRENVGSVFRTSDAFGVSKIYLTGYTPAPPHPKISKTALGAETWVLWEKRASIFDLIKELKKKKFKIIALEKTKDSGPLSGFRPRFPLALILGNEVKGISQATLKKADKIVEIPMLGRKESLNVAVAFGVAAFNMRFTKFLR
ncbi:MAG: TrmH family RNA methyltransferase [bacterium]|nr:TrmH family RNA methyltransferase [bacterium]